MLFVCGVRRFSKLEHGRSTLELNDRLKRGALVPLTTAISVQSLLGHLLNKWQHTTRCSHLVNLSDPNSCCLEDGSNVNMSHFFLEPCV